jgi:hypothetical protein
LVLHLKKTGPVNNESHPETVDLISLYEVQLEASLPAKKIIFRHYDHPSQQDRITRHRPQLHPLSLPVHDNINDRAVMNPVPPAPQQVHDHTVCPKIPVKAPSLNPADPVNRIIAPHKVRTPGLADQPLIYTLTTPLPVPPIFEAKVPLPPEQTDLINPAE